MKGVWIFLILLAWSKTATATDNHTYQVDEYATISGGRSPDGRWSIAAHGEGEYGYDHFHLYLMREPVHERLAALPTGEHLDTGPLSIVGNWSSDSSSVVVLYRSDRRILDVALFNVVDGKVTTIKVPSLVGVIGEKYLKFAVRRELFGRYYRVMWKDDNHLSLEEFVTFSAAEAVFNSGLEPYLSVERMSENRTFTNFSAVAVYDISEKGKSRFLEVKPLPDQQKTIIYSPHLIFDPERGLHNTETTASSLEVPAANQ